MTFFLLSVSTASCSVPKVSNTNLPSGDNNSNIGFQRFLESYFSSWSNKDIFSYESHFHKDAIVMLVNDGLIQRNDNIKDFIQGQDSFLSTVNTPVSENMTTFTVDYYEGKFANVTARWKLTVGEEIKTGVDHFTLIQDEDNNWKILVLVWYIDD